MAKKKAGKKRISKPKTKAKDKPKSLSRSGQLILAMLIIGIGALFCLLLFEAKIGLAGDDSTTIYTALRVLEDGVYPTFHGPLYPLFLATIIGTFGFNILLLKFLSFVFLIGSFVLFYFSYRDEVPFLALLTLLPLFAWNSYFLYYGSMTFAEAFFMVLQIGLVFYFYRHWNRLIECSMERDSLIKWAGLGLGIFLIGLSRNAGVACIGAFVLFWLIYKEWKPLGFTLAAYAAFRIPYEVIMKVAGVGQQFSTQGKIFLYKDPYDFNAGREDFMGYINRFTGNIDLYISKQTPKVLGLRPENTTDTSTLVSLLIVAAAVAAFVYLYKRNRKLVFALTLFVAYTGVSFLTLHKRWDQDRLIIPYIPYLLVVFVGALALWGKAKNLRAIHVILPALLGLMTLPILTRTFTKIKANSITLQKNLGGDPLYGYNQDYRNYMEMSKWAAENLPDSSRVACRKGSISTVISGSRKFSGISRVPSQDPDELLQFLKDRNITHVLVGSLRLNPNIKNGQLITTVHNVVALIEREYRGTFRLVHQIGAEDDEPAKLYVLTR
ncbi:MAG: hypothetical protein KTR24_14790 [Saprospiraceae bacterium]|nr:hypothetical protein [Saprospiraceae bacterium]